MLCQSEPFQQPGDAGVPLYPKEVQLGPDGEILVRGPGIFAGYWKNEEATRDVVRDGWFHTGDVAEFMPNGHFRIVDRKKDIMITAGRQEYRAERESKISSNRARSSARPSCLPMGANFRAR